jgi:putative ABC transport system permease protein
MSNSRPMFWRIVRRLLIANRGRMIVILLALGAGAAVTAALLNLQVDARRRLTAEFRAFGPNIVVAPRQQPELGGVLLNESVLQQISASSQGQQVGIRPVLYLNADAVAAHPPVHVVVVGVAGDGVPPFVARGPLEPYKSGIYTYSPRCIVGATAASRIQPHVATLAEEGGGPVHLMIDKTSEVCDSMVAAATGGPEDDQVIMPLIVAQRLAMLPGKISLVEVTATGTPAQIQNYIASLKQGLAELDVHGIRQFTEAEGKIYERISGLLTATVAVVLILTTLCVMAAMTNVAMERKNDVGLMKAIGGATRRVLRLFLAEAATLGLIAGLIGAAAGLALSVALGKAVFGVAAQPRLIVYPVVVALTIVVAVAGAYPLRRLAGIRPASVFRGEA